MDEKILQLPEAVTISIERMMRFCYLAQMTMEQPDPQQGLLPTHLTRFGTLLLDTCSFLYSLFDDRRDSIHLARVWAGFDHPFYDALTAIENRLQPFKPQLKLVRHRYGFHGSLSRTLEAEGFDILQDPLAGDLCTLIHDVKQLAVHMIAWHIDRMPCDHAERGALLAAFKAELCGPGGSVA